ncbi:MAG: hypothetical protein QXW66_07365 [Archaeoglobaceae archaeon]
MIVRFESVKELKTIEGFLRPMFVSEKILLMYCRVWKGLRVEPHSHESEGILIVTKGRIRVLPEGIEIAPLDLCHVPPKKEVGLVAEDDSELILISMGSKYKTLEEVFSVLSAFEVKNES